MRDTHGLAQDIPKAWCGKPFSAAQSRHITAASHGQRDDGKRVSAPIEFQGIHDVRPRRRTMVDLPRYAERQGTESGSDALNRSRIPHP